MDETRRIHWDDMPDIMGTADVMEVLGISKDTALKLIHQPKFPKIRVCNGRKFLIPKTRLIEYLNEKAGA